MSENGDDKSQQSRRRVARYTTNRNNNNNPRNNNNNRSNQNQRFNDRNGGNFRNRNVNFEEKELASQLIQIAPKRFYIDVKENERGRFFKLAEVGLGGRKSRILLTCNAAVEFNTRLAEFIEANAALPPSPEPAAKPEEKRDSPSGDKSPSGANEGILKSLAIVRDQKRYYMDLKENERGRFLRVSMVINRGPRAQIAIPVQGLTEFKDHFNELLEKYNNEPADSSLHSGPGADGAAEGRSLKASNKTFYFDLGSNVRGHFLKISEVRTNQFRTSITVPVKSIEAFRDQLSQLLQDKETELAISAAANDESPQENDKEDPVDKASDKKPAPATVKSEPAETKK